jgi:DNA-binding NarL/FixJ family response regulator
MTNRTSMRPSKNPPMSFTSAAMSQMGLWGNNPPDLHRQGVLPELSLSRVKAPHAKGPLRLLLADDHEMLRLGAATFLKIQLDCEICAQASDGREALKLAQATRPDVAVIDIGLPGLNGLDVTRQIRRLLPDTEVVVLTGDNSVDGAQQALAAGAKAYIRKLDSTAFLAEAVLMAGEHRFYLTPGAHESMYRLKSPKSILRPAIGKPSLTAREREAVQLLAEGKSNKEVAGYLGISVKTVETHRATVMRKLKLGRMSDLVRYAIRHRIIHA